MACTLESANAKAASLYFVLILCVGIIDNLCGGNPAVDGGEEPRY
jgi:hypothetical protein